MKVEHIGDATLTDVEASLKDQLDAIDTATASHGVAAMEELHRIEKLGMLFKGRAVLAKYPALGDPAGGGVGSPSYREIGRETGRKYDTVKRWVDLVRRVAPAVEDRTDERFEQAAAELARRQADKWVAKVLPEPDAEPEPDTVLVATGEPPWDLILADPPWSYDDKATSGGHWAGAENHYGCMSIEALCDMRLSFNGTEYHASELAADDAELWLWTTWPFLQDAFRVIEAWGFTYKTLGFIWTKTNADGSAYMGLGNGTRIGSEPCLRAVRGKGLQRIDAGVNSDIRCSRTAHSAKPYAQYDKLGRLYGDRRRLEVFGRGRHPGWDVYGNQVQEELQYGE